MGENAAFYACKAAEKNGGSLRPPLYNQYLLSDIHGPITAGLRGLRVLAKSFGFLLLSVVLALAFPLPPKLPKGSEPDLRLGIIDSSPAITHDALPQERSLELTARVLMQIEQSEAAEPHPHLRDDIRIAWLTLFYASRGEAVECSPQVLATYKVLGLHPDKVWPAIVARRQAHLGSLYSEFYDENGNWKSDAEVRLSGSPKKPVQSVRISPQRERRG